MTDERRAPAPDGLVVVDKPGGWTSHDVVARMRRLAATRRVGHAGTLDPMATGVLLVGVGRATRLLGHLALTEKEYAATVRLGVVTNTDDAEGEVTARGDASHVTADDVRTVLPELTGVVEQVPPAFSAIKVAGRRSYARARAGESVELAARTVTIHRLDLLGVRQGAEAVDVDLDIVCSSGTYVRAIARDLGAALGVGGHLTALRRTRVGPFTLADAHGLDALAEHLVVIPIADVARAAFPARDVDDEAARIVGHGGRLPAAGLGPGPVAVFGPDGALLSLVEERDGVARPLAVFV